MVYEDPIYNNGSKWEIDGAKWYIAGVMSTSADPAGIKNPRTEYIYIQKLTPTGGLEGGPVQLKPEQLKARKPKFISRS